MRLHEFNHVSRDSLPNLPRNYSPRGRPHPWPGRVDRWFPGGVDRTSDPWQALMLAAVPPLALAHQHALQPGDDGVDRYEFGLMTGPLVSWDSIAL